MDGVFQHKVVRVWVKSAIFAVGNTFRHIDMADGGIYEAMNGTADRFFGWAQSNPKFGLLLVAALLALWLTGLLLRWKWACHWQFGGKLWLFDDCKPETRRRVQIALVSVALAACLTMFFVWR